MKKDLIPREEAFEFLIEAYNAEGGAGVKLSYKKAKAAIQSVPSVEAIEVVKCEDCVHKGWIQEPEHGKSVDYCRLIEKCVERNFFCAAFTKRPG